MSCSLQHDIAWAVTIRTLAIFNLRDEGIREAFPATYEREQDGQLGYDKEMRPASQAETILEN